MVRFSIEEHTAGLEFVRQKECYTIGGIERFYRLLGGYLAVLFALEATDFHFENLIAAAEHPVLVDLEALFHPRLEERVEAKNADDAAFQALEYSVLRVGLLPRSIWTGPDSEEEVISVV